MVAAIQDDGKSSCHGLRGNVDIAVLVGWNVDLMMVDVVFAHESDVIFWQRLRDECAGRCQSITRVSQYASVILQDGLDVKAADKVEIL